MASRTNTSTQRSLRHNPPAQAPGSLSPASLPQTSLTAIAQPCETRCLRLSPRRCFKAACSSWIPTDQRPRGISCGRSRDCFPLLWLMWGESGSLRRSDEYLRTIELEAMAIGFAVVILLSQAGGLIWAGAPMIRTKRAGRETCASFEPPGVGVMPIWRTASTCPARRSTPSRPAATARASS